ncbi:hypothetical protein D3C87_1418010 [compost metagenome]
MPATLNELEYEYFSKANAGTLPAGGEVTLASNTQLANISTELGPTTARPAVTDPASAADINQLLRGILTALNQIVINTTPP